MYKSTLFYLLHWDACALKTAFWCHHLNSSSSFAQIRILEISLNVVYAHCFICTFRVEYSVSAGHPFQRDPSRASHPHSNKKVTMHTHLERLSWPWLCAHAPWLVGKELLLTTLWPNFVTRSANFIVGDAALFLHMYVLYPAFTKLQALFYIYLYALSKFCIIR
jgi:hypothetical protein